MQDARKRRCPENPFSFSLNTVYDEPVKSINFTTKVTKEEKNLDTVGFPIRIPTSEF
jgi:hypothetical protein